MASVVLVSIDMNNNKSPCFALHCMHTTTNMCLEKHVKYVFIYIHTQETYTRTVQTYIICILVITNKIRIAARISFTHMLASFVIIITILLNNYKIIANKDIENHFVAILHGLN